MRDAWEERWQEIAEFPNYAVSDRGRIHNSWSGLILRTGINREGIPFARLSQHAQQHVRSIPVLVANAFLEPDSNPQFDTPIHLDGDRTNCWYTNLVWRPRWFAVKFHKQFKHPPMAILKGRAVIEIKSEEVYQDAWHASTTLGVVESDIYLSIVNRTIAFPFSYRFAFLEDYV